MTGDKIHKSIIFISDMAVKKDILATQLARPIFLNLNNGTSRTVTNIIVCRWKMLEIDIKIVLLCQLRLCSFLARLSISNKKKL